MKLRARLMRGLMQLGCILLLLIAQQGALMHRVWHLHDVLHGHAAANDAAQGHDQDGDDPQSGLCQLHFAAGTVLGALDCAAIVLALSAPRPERAPEFLFSQLAPDVPVATSRGPPVFL